MSTAKAGRRHWTCPYCRTRLRALGGESDGRFDERCGVHRRGRHCPAMALARRLAADGMERLLSRTGEFFGCHAVLKEAGLVQLHRTRLIGPDAAGAEPWALQWAVAYETHLRARRRPYDERVRELRAAAASPEAAECARAYLALLGEAKTSG